MLKRLLKNNIIIRFFLLFTLFCFLTLTRAYSERPSFKNGYDLCLPRLNIDNQDIEKKCDLKEILNSSDSLKEILEAAYISFFNNEFKTAELLFRKSLTLNPFCIPCIEGLSM